MKVLWLTYDLPYPPDSGTRIRDYHLIREVSKSAEIDLVSLVPRGTSGDAGPLTSICRSVETVPMPGAIAEGLRIATGALAGDDAARRIEALLDRGSYDLFQVEHSLLAHYGAAANCATVLSLHNVTYRQYERMAEQGGTMYRLKAAAMKRVERRLAPRYTRCLAVSRQERDLLAAIAPEANIEIVANGVDCEALRPSPEASGPPTLLFVGVLGYPPNSDALDYFTSSILPRIRTSIPDVRLRIVGRAQAEQARRWESVRGVEVAGYVEDLSRHYAEAHVAIVPLRSGGGTRLKILEAMARGRAVVSTSMGCEGIEAQHGRDLMVADTAEAFAKETIALLRDPAASRTLAENARRCVEERYDWRSLGARLRDIHAEAISSMPSMKRSGVKR